jgi:hypothetical protein
MQALSPSHADAGPGPSPGPKPSLASSGMDRNFIIHNQIVERYIGGRLPLKGAQDFERYCREHPAMLDELGLDDRINAALRLLDASGRAAPWEAAPKRWWESLPVLIATAVLALVLAGTSLVASSHLGARDREIASLRQRIAAQPLDPAKSTRTITVIPSRVGPYNDSLVTIGGAETQLADLKLDVSWSAFTQFRVTIDRIDQGRVAILHNVLRDSNGNLHIELNSSALGPGAYQLTMEGLTWRGDPVPQAWATIGIAH